MNEIWNPEYETMSRDELRELQFKRLQMTLRWVYENVPFHRERWANLKLKPGDIRSLDDLHKVPFTVKADFKAAYPYGLFALPLEKVVRVHASSGMMSNPTVMGYSRGDLSTWSELCARVAVAGGARYHDVAQIAFEYGLTTGAFGMHAGLERVGVTVIPASTGNTIRQLQIMRDFETTVLVGTPSYVMHLTDVALESGYDFKDLKLRVGLLGSEPWTNQLRTRLEERTGMSACDIYGLSEVIGPGVSFECWNKDGLHINEDHLLVEVIDPETGEPVPEGKEGELVFTSLTKEAVPVIRYRSGDLAGVSYRPCVCGRTLARHSKVYARTDDMFVIRGVNVYPASIEAVLLDIEKAEPHYQVILYREGSLDQIEVQMEVAPSFFSDAVRKLQSFQQHVEERLRQELGIRPRVRLVEPKTIPRSSGVARRVVDNRGV
ncbi:MAG: phenylacetate--CoA ligase [Actinobacteria bacterium]|jgi:phenylacetate-CoA ligase|nr:phenylacetate--CoA ligase [Actinomycetota bacterium]